MSFSPIVPLGGIGGWAFVKRTMATQKAAYEATPGNQRDDEYFRARIGSVSTAEQLVSDRRLLKVALGAFGLEGDIANRYFIRKVLEEGTLSTGALSSKLADKSYQKLSAALGFGDFAIPRTQLSSFPDEILAAYSERRFEAAVGEKNENMRLALNAQREFATIAKSSSSEQTKWFSILGSEPLRKVVETAFGLPSVFASIDLDQQVTVMKQKAQAAFGDDSVAQFSDSKRLETLLQRFLSRSDTAAPSTGRGYGALQLLQAGRENGSARILSLLS